MAETLSQFWVVVEEKLNELVNEEEQLKNLTPMIPKLFSVQSTQEAFAQFLGISDLPDLLDFDGQYRELSVFPGYKNRIIFPEFGGKVVAERKLIDDGGIGQVYADAQAFVRSASRRAETKAAEFWSGLTNASWDFMESDEAVSIASNLHTTTVPDINTSTGFDNLGVIPFDYDGLHETMYNLRQFRDSNGNQIERGEKVFGILHPDWLTWKVEQTIGTEKGLDGPDMNVNPAHKNLLGNKRFVSIPYSRLDASSINSWTLLDLEGIMRNFVFFNRIKGDYKTHVDRETENLIQTYYKRFGLGAKPNAWREIIHNDIPNP